jgi:hypothetical protein
MHRRLAARLARAAALVAMVVVGGVAMGAAPREAAADGARPPAPPVALAGPVPGSVAKVTPPPPPPPSLPGSSARTVVVPPRSAEWAGALARRLGLAYEDGGAFVLLSDANCRVRLYPNSQLISLDGQDMRLRGTFVRDMQGVLVPGPAVGIIEHHVLTARIPRVVAPPPAPKPAPPAPPVAKVPVAAAASKKAVPAAGPVSPDPSWAVAGTGREWKWIILHHSDDTSGCVSKYHQGHLDQGWEHGCGYHFVIGNGTLSGDGEVETSKRWQQQLQGAHAKTPDNRYNDHGIGICLVGDFEIGSGRPTAAQMKSLIRLVQWLMDRYDIAIADVKGHCHCKATCCPGKNFPWTELRSALRDSRRVVAAAAPAPASPLAQRAPAPVAPAAHLAARTAPPAVADLGSPPAGPAPVVFPTAPAKP